MECDLKLNTTDQNNNFLQDLVLKLVMLEVTDQTSSKDLLIKAQELKSLLLQ